MQADREFDIVLYGATGFTGKLVVEYLASRYGKDKSLKWAMAGRDLAKLEAVREETGAPVDTPLIVADSSDLASLQAMVKRTKVVITTVGPYQLYGSELVAACSDAGTDYVDLCGEPTWMRLMIDANEAKAKASGARIVFSCGFDSIPFDLGVLYLQDKIRAKFGHGAVRVKGRVRKMRGTFSGGTAASLKATLAAAAQDPNILALLKNPFALTPGFEGPKQPHGNKPELDADMNSWVAPFVMAPINTRNVHRSNALLGHAYGTDFVYDEMIAVGPGDKGEAMARAMAASGSGMEKEGSLKPGEGPSRAERESGFYDVLFIGKTREGQELRVSVKGDRDPGYGSTSKMIAEAAICLLRDGIKTKGGIWSPASAMGMPLVNRLQKNAGLTFAVE